MSRQMGWRGREAFISPSGILQPFCVYLSHQSVDSDFNGFGELLAEVLLWSKNEDLI